jgi:hypothetical protein
MTIIATYVTESKTVKNQIFRINNIWGNKATGWNAFVGLYKNAKDKEPYDTFHVDTPYVAWQNPFPSLYEAISKLAFVKDATSDEIEETVEQFPSEYIIENSMPVDVPKKKSRAKKNSA